MADKVQVNLTVPDWRRKQIKRRAEANNQSLVDYMIGLVDQEESLAKGKAIIIINPDRSSHLTLKEVVNG